jgi:signal transduction histidine kinase
MAAEEVCLDRRSKFWLGAVAVVVVTFILAALLVPRSFALTALSDIVQCLLLASGVGAFVPLAMRSKGRVRLFWSLLTVGVALWLAYQLFWTYHEVVLRQDVPDLCTWDVVLFLHIVPLMAAIALRPQIARDQYSARVGRLDFALLLVWWFYLYVLIVMPWQYVMPDIPAYDRNLNNIYVSEQLFLLAGLLACWILSKGAWRKLYSALFGVSLCYSSASTIANWALARRVYYSGSFYDIPLVASMAWITVIGLRAKLDRPDSDAADGSTVYGVWVARCSMITVFSLPLFAAWAMSDVDVPSRIRVFRLTLTLLAAFSMGVMVFVRQRMLDRELFRLLNQSRESVDNLQRLQTQLLQSEKLASIGQLVGGAAHELNNPITAMLGYSDLLLNTPLTAEQQPLAAKIGQHVRRTRSLVASLISFARQGPAPKTQIDLNILLRTAIKLAEPQSVALEIEVRAQLFTPLPKVLGDSNQLLQVCQQLIANFFHVLSERDGKVLTITTESNADNCVLQISTDAAPVSPSTNSQTTPAIDPESELALSACHAILQEHRGRVSLERYENGRLLLRVELPIAGAVPEAAAGSTPPALWQSQPYA